MNEPLGTRVSETTDGPRLVFFRLLSSYRRGSVAAVARSAPTPPTERYEACARLEMEMMLQ